MNLPDTRELTAITTDAKNGKYAIFVFAFGVRMHYEISEKPSEEEISILSQKIEQRLSYELGLKGK